MVPAGEFIVGTLIVAGIVKQEDAERAVKIVEEELEVWLAIKNFKSH
jgi:TATA-box binding protein (TBP) (component of TFIID and TFIIIB)